MGIPSIELDCDEKFDDIPKASEGETSLSQRFVTDNNDWKVCAMKSLNFPRTLKVCLLALGAMFMSQSVLAVDEAAAQALAKKSDCLKCHSVEKEKKGPSYKKISAKYKGKADGEASIIKNITTGPKVKLDDGSEEDHKIIKTKDEAAIKNLAQWILSQ